jgi:DNA polymerase III epsilon subunit-like protein
MARVNWERKTPKPRKPKGVKMRVLLVDIETQGLDKVNPFITEIGASLFTVTSCPVAGSDSWEETKSGAWLCYENEYPPQPEMIIKLTGITDAMLRTMGKPRKDIFNAHLIPLMEKADVVFAHNKAFDQVILERTGELVGQSLPKKEWICTRNDFPWRPDLTCYKLQHLAYEHRLFWKHNIDPDSLHRADGDVKLLALLMGQYKMKDILAYAREPQILLVADVHHPRIDGGVQNKIAGSLGFRWDPELKIWFQNVRESKFGKIMDTVLNSASPFRVSVKGAKA